MKSVDPRVDRRSDIAWHLVREGRVWYPRVQVQAVEVKLARTAIDTRILTFGDQQLLLQPSNLLFEFFDPRNGLCAALRDGDAVLLEMGLEVDEACTVLELYFLGLCVKEREEAVGIEAGRNEEECLVYML